MKIIVYLVFFKAECYFPPSIWGYHPPPPEKKINSSPYKKSKLPKQNMYFICILYIFVNKNLQNIMEPIVYSKLQNLHPREERRTQLHVCPTKPSYPCRLLALGVALVPVSRPVRSADWFVVQSETLAAPGLWIGQHEGRDKHVVVVARCCLVTWTDSLTCLYYSPTKRKIVRLLSFFYMYL